MSFFKKLFGGGLANQKVNTQKTKQSKSINTNSSKLQATVGNNTSEVPEIVCRYRQAYNEQPLRKLNDLYHELLEKILVADKEGKVDEVLMHSQGSLGLLESIIKYNKKEYGSFKIKTIPALEKALIYYAINGNTGQLKNIQDIVNYFKELQPYKDEVDKAFKRRHIAARIYQYVKANPNCFQHELKKKLEEEDGRFIAATVGYMEKADKLKRIKRNGKTLLNVK
ncbi:hypothetical protein [Jiulongibacter sp. NS-SX5]|uniref:hypothetical protein n=1 Tax=Jiulongibacter sp. NS-SX5 TaxID=3463854 RepID=UPI004059041C